MDTLESGVPENDQTFAKTVKDMASMARVLGPHAGSSDQTSKTPEKPSLMARVKGGVETLKDNTEGLKDRLESSPVLKERQADVGDYTLRFKPMDLDLKPRWKDGGPALKFKGDLLETTLAKTDDVGGDWVRRQGLSQKISGDVSTYSDSKLDLEVGAFREYRGPVGDKFEGRLRANAGVRHRVFGPDDGTRVGVNFRQELEGGDYSVLGQNFDLYAEGNQSVYHNLDSDRTNLGYSFMVGAKKDIPVKLGRFEGKLSVTAGPEIKGSNNGEPFELGFESKIRARF